MKTIIHNGKTFKVNGDGFLMVDEEHKDLVCPPISQSWGDEWIDFIRSSEGIKTVTEEHKKVTGVLQKYYAKNGIAPMIRVLCRTTGFSIHKIWDLYPEHGQITACKMAGLPKSTGCV